MAVELATVLDSGDILKITLNGVDLKHEVQTKAFMTLVPSDGSGVPNNSFWLRSSDSEVIWRDSTGTDRPVFIG